MFAYVGRDFFKENPEALLEFKEIAAKINNTYSKRNEIEHAVWQHYGPKSGPSTAVRVLRDASVDPQFKSAKDVEAVAQDIIKLIVVLNEFMEKNVPAPLKSSQDK